TWAPHAGLGQARGLGGFPRRGIECRAPLEQKLPMSAPDHDPFEPAKESASPEAGSFGFRRALAKVREFPTTPGIYLFKDSAGRVIYVGKAKNLRSRAASYFLKASGGDRRTVPDLMREVCDADFLAADSEVDALLLEARLIKDVQPKFNVELKDDKTFP